MVDGGCDCISIFVPSLEHILQNIKDKMSSLQWLTCKLNMKADQPSKEAVQCQPGSLISMNLWMAMGHWPWSFKY